MSSVRTIITIAHRLSSIINADRVFVLDNGRIVGEGTHAGLLGNNGVYDQLFRKQYIPANTQQDSA